MPRLSRNPLRPSRRAAAEPRPKRSRKRRSANCKTVITKAEFEKLANGSRPDFTPQLKKQLAIGLPRFIAISAEAKKEGIDKSEDYKEMVKFVQMQVLTNVLQKKIQEGRG